VEQGRQALHTLLDANPHITAVICSNDTLALGALWGARQRKVKVPQKLSITGFDNMEMIPALSPALTTVNSPSKRMGVLAAEYLLEQINSNRTKIKRIKIEAELIVRETTGPVPN
jgi:LacI family transcriptional regulator